LLLVAVIVKENGMDVAVAGVEDVGDLEAVLAADFVDAGQDRRELAARDAGVLGAIRVGNSADCAEGGFAGFPEGGAAIGIGGGFQTLDNPRRASKAIALVLVSTIAVFFGFKSCYEADENESWSSTTQPSGSGSHTSGGHYWSSGSRGYSGGSSGSHFSGTSRGGFGSSGHFAGS